MGTFPTGVAVVTATGAGGEPVGLTVNSLTSVSLYPPLILVCIDHGSASHDAIVDSGRFGVNLLKDSGRELSDRFATGTREDRFQDLGWHPGPAGSPLLDDALAWIDCEVYQAHVAGDHTIVVGRVVDCDHTDDDPLVYHRGRYRKLAGP